MKVGIVGCGLCRAGVAKGDGMQDVLRLGAGEVEIDQHDLARHSLQDHGEGSAAAVLAGDYADLAAPP